MTRRWVAALIGVGWVVAVAAGCHSGVAEEEVAGEAASPSVRVSTAPAGPSPAPCPKPGSASRSVEVTGALFTAPKVTFKAPLKVDQVEASTPIASSGEQVSPGDVVHVAYSVYSGRTGQLVETTNHNVKELAPLHVGNGLLPGLRGALACAGTQSRVVVVIPPDQAFGDRGDKSLGITGGETVVFVIDIDSLTPKAELPTE